MMNSRERVNAAINHKEPDRVPIDLGGHRCSSISAMAYFRLKKYLGMQTGEIYIYELCQQLAIVEPEILDEFSCDIIDLGRGFYLDQAEWRPWYLQDGTSCKVLRYNNLEKRDEDWYILADDGTPLGVKKEDMIYFDQIYYPFADPDGRRYDRLGEAFGRSMWTRTHTPPDMFRGNKERLGVLKNGAEKLRNSTDKAIHAWFGGCLHEMGQFLFDPGIWFVMLASEKMEVHKFLEKLLESYMQELDDYLDAVENCIDIIGFSDDLGMQTGPQISKKMYEEFYKPRHVQMWKRVKERTDAKIMLHCCGGVYPLLPDFIEAGLDIINPVQVNCAGMDSGDLKREFGKDLVFWGGGCDTQRVLPNGTTEDVEEEVKIRINDLAPGGGFVFSAVHNIQANVPVKNIVKMFETVRKFGKY